MGDWLLLNHEYCFERLLERSTSFSRKAAGNKVERQQIAANVDTVFIVCALNHNFNLNRIERYLALTNEAGAEAVVVLTKADLSDQPQRYLQQVQQLDPMLMVETINALDCSTREQLSPWLKAGKTIALLGSSGVGKSTLVNTLCEEHSQFTQAAREDDDRGRHTTTARSLHLMASGAMLLDTPGMRELQLVDCEQGVGQTFADIEALAQQCRFSDCHHETEPGCAVQAAISRGDLEQRRWLNYSKLLREQAMNSETLAQKRAREKDTTQYHHRVLQQAYFDKNR